MEVFINQLKEKHQSNMKLIDEIAGILDIKYDAAYRRISGMAKFSLEESLLLAKHYNISLDTLIERNDQEMFLLPKENSMKNIDEIAVYLEKSYQTLLPFFNDKQSKIIYSSKDLPIFYTLGEGILARFKMYAWLWMLDAKFPALQLQFSHFSLPKKIIETGEKLENAYKDLSVTEFWNENVLQSVLYQIRYFSDLGLLHESDKQRILEELKRVIKTIEQKLLPKETDKNHPTFDIFVNELLLMNNSISLYSSKQQMMLFPLTILGFIEMRNKEILNEQIRYYEMQKQNSVRLSGGNQKARSLFFKKLYEQIENTYPTLPSKLISNNF